MRQFDSGRVQDKLIDRLDRREKQKAFKLDRFFRFRLAEVHNQLTQTLLMQRVIETESPKAVSDLILKGLKKALRSSEFDFRYFVSPIRDLVPRPNPLSLYMTQYVNEVMIGDPDVIDVYGTDIEIYEHINRVVSQIKAHFDKTEADVMAQMANSKSLTPGTKDYEITMDQMLRKRLGDPQIEV